MNTAGNLASVVAVCKKAEPGLPKQVVDAIQLVENYGVAGDYHAGEFVRHRYLANKDPNKPNLRQVLLVDTSMFAAIAGKGIRLAPGMMGENIIIEGMSVMTLPIGSRLEIADALLEVTEIRNPCLQLNEMHPRLLKAVAYKVDSKVQRNAGMMARVLKGGTVKPGDAVSVQK